jgi:hypothetical protein
MKEAVPDTSSARRNRWCIMSLAMRVGRLEVVGRTRGWLAHCASQLGRGAKFF